MTEWQRWQQIVGKASFALLVLALLAWITDWAVWHVRATRGSSATACVDVSRMVVAPLKGNREEYYMDGTVAVACSESLFPQGGMEPCWWLQRHRDIFER